jgi:predicted XRE-type DNA-binding protein
VGTHGSDLSERRLRCGTVSPVPADANPKEQVLGEGPLLGDGRIQAYFGGKAEKVKPRRRSIGTKVERWMQRTNVESQKQAARRLGVSIDVLKSIMSDKGRARYSEDTLKQVLNNIGHEEDL